MNDTTKLYGNIYLEPDSIPSPDDMQSILEGFGDDYDRLLPALANGDIETDGLTCDQFNDACESWLIANPADDEE